MIISLMSGDLRLHICSVRVHICVSLFLIIAMITIIIQVATPFTDVVGYQRFGSHADSIFRAKFQAAWSHFAFG
jgi:hypothetical protein